MSLEDNKKTAFGTDPTSPDLDFKSKPCENLPIPCDFFRIAEPRYIMWASVVIFAGMS